MVRASSHCVVGQRRSYSSRVLRRVLLSSSLVHRPLHLVRDSHLLPLPDTFIDLTVSSTLLFDLSSLLPIVVVPTLLQMLQSSLSSLFFLSSSPSSFPFPLADCPCCSIPSQCPRLSAHFLVDLVVITALPMSSHTVGRFGNACWVSCSALGLVDVFMVVSSLGVGYLNRIREQGSPSCFVLAVGVVSLLVLALFLRGTTCRALLALLSDDGYEGGR